ncbi:MAG: S8 family serine peptidase, partial [Terriglobales bacterium]
MNNNDKSQVTNGRVGRPLNSPAFSAAWGRVLGLVLLTLSAMPSYAAKTKPPKYSPDLAAWVAASTNGKVTVNVQYKAFPTKSYLKARQTAGATVRWQLPTITAVNMTVPVSMIATLEGEANVVYISPDRPLNLMSNPTTEEFATAVEADVAASQYALTGAGVGVALIDSGIAAHPDLNDGNGNSRVVYSQSFVAGDTTTSDKFGHGTHVAGLIGGTGASSGTANGYAATYAGMAPGVNLINLRVLDQNGSGTDSGVVAAIQEAITLQ